jgi:hypothetical protein
MTYFPERKFPRVDFSQLPWVFTLRVPEPAGPDKPFRLEARNVSRGGIKFSCNRRFELFEVLEVQFLLKASGKPLPATRGKVVRVEEIDTGYGERTYGIALEFLSSAGELLDLPPASGK